MNRKLTITVSEAVNEGLHRTVGRRCISQFLEKLARPHVLPEDIDASYREMAEDQARESESLSWSEAVIGDLSGSDPNARAEVWWVDFGPSLVGEIKKIRPASDR